MYGSLLGNVIAALFFLGFQLVGICIALRLLNKESRSFQLLLGSVFGSFALHWLPTIFSLAIGFNKFSNLLGLVVFVLIGIVICAIGTNHDKGRLSPKTKGLSSVKERRSNKERFNEMAIWLFILPTFIYVILTLWNHTIMDIDGAMYAGQCTYGDMNLHLGIITSIANQGVFPPEYSIFPGAKLSYPFLSDSISSSMYVFGASLKLSYLFPMLFAFIQVFYGFYLFAFGWLKKQSTAIVAWVLFFFNGGFGFFYFLDGAVSDPTKFTRIFTEFYQTPTNLVSSNIRWVNIIVDMLIPQRATLFGYALLFPILCLLYKAVFEDHKRYFMIAGILVSGLPMIHTHSFLAIGVICAGWLFYSLYKKYEKREEWTHREKVVLGCSLCIPLIIMELISYNTEKISQNVLFAIPMVLLIPIILTMFYLIVKHRKDNLKFLLGTWGVFLLIIIIPVVWQLFTWTFQQASKGNFLKGQFNWANETDSYLWFYLKNIGIVSILAIPAILKARKKHFYIIFPALLLWFIAEFIGFQPNKYDNNKLLYPAYAFICCIVAKYMISIFKKIKVKSFRYSVTTIIIVLSTTSAVLTMGREIVSKYELYSQNQVELSEYIEKSTPVDSIILTDTRHNNAISSLTGRNIVCGTSSFLYYHGIDYSSRLEEMKLIYQDVLQNKALIEKNKIDYILVGPEEYATFPELNEEVMKQTYQSVYSEGSITLYAVSERANTIIASK